MAAVQNTFKAFLASGTTVKTVNLVALATFAVLLAGLSTGNPSALAASVPSSAPGHLGAHNLTFDHPQPPLAAPKAHHLEARSPARPAFSAALPACMALTPRSPTTCLLAAALCIAALLYAAAAPSQGAAPGDAAPPPPHTAPPHAATQSLKRARSLSPVGSPNSQQQRVRPEQRRLAAWLASSLQSQQAMVQRGVELQCRRLAAMRQDLDARKAWRQGRGTAVGC